MVHYGKGETNGLNKLDMGNVVVSLEGLFIGKEDEFVEVDIDSWEEVFPRIVRLRLRVK
ncbi:hypothetical protein P691DRAFT_807601 [Macrolepiota fuliginosa MF-IS2]|uniref:Uncharacterized protein n=1 Tax=Macrolepiota fuliginosa MF-IS2 TaxID=1400762 RepID=A0A9P5XID4_9AGAR|nr:hypothetical protein P691DRAFT_807601 [Macrolepiota fuliginosa MF-IS2]